MAESNLHVYFGQRAAKYLKPEDKADMPIIATDNSKKNYPPMWSVYEQHVSAYPPNAFSFVDRTQPNRFAARYRAAKCFKHIEFEYFHQTTAEGYSVLCKTLLTYSAFEYLLKAAKISDTNKLLTSNEKATAGAKLRRLDQPNDFIKLLHANTRGRTKEQLGDHLAGKICNPLVVAAAIRHTFAHGILTASPKDIDPESIIKVCSYMIILLIRVMDREVKQRMLKFITAAGLVSKK